jgi:2-(3-amino-3-carboxypropyl)histidine synthase
MDENISELIDEIKKRGTRRVLVQIPEGLKTRAFVMISDLRNAGIDAILCGEACYGACDIKDDYAASMDCEMIVHIGHSKFYRDFKTKVPVLYFPWAAKIDVNNIDFSELKESRIGLLASIQHMNLINKIKLKLEEKSFVVLIGGQILGCWTTNAEKIKDRVDAFLFIGTGSFHAFRVKNKPVYVLDLEKMAVQKVDSTLMEKRKYARIFKAMEAKSFGVLVSSKKGQFELQGKAEDVKRSLEQKGKSAEIIIMDEISNAKLMGIKFDAFINTACPRITDDVFEKPIINAEDLDEILE